MIGIPGQADELKRAYVRGAFRGLVASTEDLLARAVADAPVDEGTLRQSAVIAYIVNGRRFDDAPSALLYAIERIDAGPLHVHGEVSFNTEYAAAQHEGIAFMIRRDTGTGYVWQAHKYPGGGGPKFLERNLIANEERYMKVIAAAAKKSINAIQ